MRERARRVMLAEGTEGTGAFSKINAALNTDYSRKKKEKKRKEKKTHFICSDLLNIYVSVTNTRILFYIVLNATILRERC